MKRSFFERLKVFGKVLVRILVILFSFIWISCQIALIGEIGVTDHFSSKWLFVFVSVVILEALCLLRQLKKIFGVFLSSDGGVVPDNFHLFLWNSFLISLMGIYATRDDFVFCVFIGFLFLELIYLLGFISSKPSVVSDPSSQYLSSSEISSIPHRTSSSQILPKHARSPEGARSQENANLFDYQEGGDISLFRDETRLTFRDEARLKLRNRLVIPEIGANGKVIVPICGICKRTLRVPKQLELEPNRESEPFYVVCKFCELKLTNQSKG
jgi:hypothetical protein